MSFKLCSKSPRESTWQWGHPTIQQAPQHERTVLTSEPERSPSGARQVQNQAAYGAGRNILQHTSTQPNALTTARWQEMPSTSAGGAWHWIGLPAVKAR
jgi:hypothetical protein